MSSDEKEKFTAVICIISSYTFAYVGWKTVRKKQSQADNKLQIYTDSENIFIHKTFFCKSSVVMVGTAVLKIVHSLKLGMIFKTARTSSAKSRCQKLVQLFLK